MKHIFLLKKRGNRIFISQYGKRKQSKNNLPWLIKSILNLAKQLSTLDLLHDEHIKSYTSPIDKIEDMVRVGD